MNSAMWIVKIFVSRCINSILLAEKLLRMVNILRNPTVCVSGGFYFAFIRMNLKERKKKKWINLVFSIKFGNVKIYLHITVYEDEMGYVD